MHIVAPEAAADLDEAWYYIARESASVDRADHQIDMITEHFYSFSTHPHLGRKRDDDLRPGLRGLVVGKYGVIYRITDVGDVVILHVPHGRQDLPQIIDPR